jgi:DNA modification methylase
MKLKHAILSVIGRDTLKDIVDALEIDGVDRRSAKEMAAAVKRARRATPEFLLEYLGEAEVKEVCETYGISSKGRRRTLVEALLQAEGPRGGQTRAKRAGNVQARRQNIHKGKKNSSEVETSMANDKQNETQEPIRLPDPPPGMVRVNKVELVWPGKYNEDGTRKEVPRVSLPFQVIERVNESRATRKAKKAIGPTLFDIYQADEGESFEDGWRNKLIWGDNLLVMGSLLEKFAGKIDLIYIDPPFATGADFSFQAPIGEPGNEVSKEPSIIEEKAYRDTWGRGMASYLTMMAQRLTLMRDLLSSSGTVYVHVGVGVAHFVKLLLDEVFGPDQFRSQVIWHYRRWTNVSDTYQQMHDVLLYYTKGDGATFNRIEIAPTESQQAVIDKGYNVNRVSAKGGGKILQLLVYDRAKVDALVATGRLDLSKYGRVVYREQKLTVANDVWTDIQYLHSQALERTGYDTQKPESLLERVVSISSNPGDLVADFFCGSGTTLAVAEKLGRRWIGCDLGRWAIHVTRKRLLDIEKCRPFEVLNLGKYERQYWQGVTFGDKKDKTVTERALYEYLAFILKLYGAQPVSGLAHLHGKKGRAMVHIGAVDAPVTIDEISQALEECARLKQPELHVLGWEWEMGLAGPNNEYRKGGLMQEEARKKGVKLMLLQIPREVMETQAVEKGDVQFFELAYLRVDVAVKKRTVTVSLKDFVIPNTELIPEDVRSKIKKWSDYIDYWAVDWDFQNDTFMQGWVTYRTRKNRKLALTSDPHIYEKPGRYRILVKVVDIFGNDTSQAYDVEVK